MWHGSVFDCPNIEEFDIVVALNIFHHFLKTKELFEQFEALLERVDASVMIFQAHLHDPPGQMTDAYKNFPPNVFAEFVSKRLGFTEIELIGRGGDRRPILF